MIRKLFIGLLLFAMICITPVQGAELMDVDIHGFLSEGFLWSANNNFYSAQTTDGSFQFNELGLNISKSLTDRLRLGMQFFSRDLGRTGNNDVVIDWAFGDYRWKDWLGFRAGLMKMPHGLYNEIRDQDMLRTSVLLPQSVYPEMVRDYYTRMWGCGIYGNIFANNMGNISYKLMVGTYNPDTENSGLTVLVEGGGLIRVEEFDHGTQYAAGLVWDTPLSGLRVGATGWLMNEAGARFHMLADWGSIPGGTTTEYEVKRWATVYSIEYIWRNLRLTTEYWLEHTENEWTEYKDMPKGETDADGFFLSAAYRFTEWFELGSYYSLMYPDKDDRDGDRYKGWNMDDFLAWQKDWALSFLFNVNEYWLIKLEGHVIDGAAGLLGSDNPDGYDQHDFLFAGKVTFNF